MVCFYENCSKIFSLTVAHIERVSPVLESVILRLRFDKKNFRINILVRVILSDSIRG